MIWYRRIAPLMAACVAGLGLSSASVTNVNAQGGGAMKLTPMTGHLIIYIGSVKFITPFLYPMPLRGAGD